MMGFIMFLVFFAIFLIFLVGAQEQDIEKKLNEMDKKLDALLDEIYD